MVSLNSDLIKTFKVAKTFRDNTERINYMDISASGHYVVTSSEDESIQLYECDKAILSKTLHSKKYGVSLISFTKNEKMVVHGSTKIDNTLRQLNLQENKYLRYFQGHTNKVTGLKMHPKDDVFLSSSQDGSIRLWDTRSQNAQGLLSVPSRPGTAPVANYDPEGVIMAVGSESSEVRLYDLRTFDKVSGTSTKGAFLTFPVPQIKDGYWTDIKFNPDTTQILITTSGKNAILVDAYVGGVAHTLTGYSSASKYPMEASFTPDGRYVLMGSADGKIHVWESISGEKVCVLTGESSDPITCLRFNPKYMTFATASQRTHFWIPTVPPSLDKTDSSLENGIAKTPS